MRSTVMEPLVCQNVENNVVYPFVLTTIKKNLGAFIDLCFIFHPAPWKDEMQHISGLVL